MRPFKTTISPLPPPLATHILSLYNHAFHLDQSRPLLIRIGVQTYFDEPYRLLAQLESMKDDILAVHLELERIQDDAEAAGHYLVMSYMVDAKYWVGRVDEFRGKVEGGMRRVADGMRRSVGGVVWSEERVDQALGRKKGEGGGGVGAVYGNGDGYGYGREGGQANVVVTGEVDRHAHYHANGQQNWLVNRRGYEHGGAAMQNPMGQVAGTATPVAPELVRWYRNSGY